MRGARSGTGEAHVWVEGSGRRIAGTSGGPVHANGRPCACQRSARPIRIGGIDRCVSKFIRISDRLLPARVFRRLMPELDHGSGTPPGVPVWVQLLGSNPVCLAENAGLLANFGPESIDLNFGCPAKAVSRRRPGAVPLDEPALLLPIVSVVWPAVPAHFGDSLPT